MSNSPSLEPEALLAQAGWIRALARSLVRGDEVDDLVQDTWHAALQRPPRVHSESGLRAWLGRVARNLAIDRRRAGAARAERSTRAHREPPERPDEAFERVVLQRRLVDAVLALDEPYRSAVIWRYFDGLDPRAIAERQGVSHDAARQRIARALARLRSRLDREYDGGRAQWVAFAGSLFEHAAPAPWITGGALMGAKWMGVAAIAVIGLASWWWWRTESAELAGERTNVVASAKLDAPNENEAANAVVAHSEATERVALEDSAQLVAAPRAIDRERDLHGVVVDPDGKPVANADVRVLENLFAEESVLDLEHVWQRKQVAAQRTDERGEFVIPLEVARPYDLEASSTGFCTVVVPHCHAGERVVVTLLPGATVSGRVVRAKDGSAVANAKVQLPTRPHELRPASEGAEQTTDADGRFRFSDVDEGEYWVQVFPLADAPPDWIEADVKRGAELDLAITVGAGSVVSGRVVDATTGEPIAGAEVGEGWTFHRFVKTDWNGEFEFKGFAEAGYDDIAVRAKGYGRIARTVRNANGPVAERIEVKLARVRVLRGRVVDSSGAPVDGAYVAAPAYILGARTPNSEDAHQLDWPSTFSAADGRYALDVRPDMQHTLYVRKRGFGVASYEVPGRELAEAEFVLPDVVLEAGAIVRGVVVDERKQPLADQVVSLHGRNGDHEAWASSTTNQAAAGYISERTTRTDDLGRFAFADVAAGTYALLHLRADSHDREPVPITVTAGEKPTPITLVAPTGTMIHGVVLGPEGEPVSANVSIDRVDGAPGVTSADVRTAADGSFTASGLAAGSYVCTAWPMSLFGVKPGEPRYSMAKSEPIDAGGAAITIRVARAELVVGRVLDANGKPVVDCTVCVFDGRDEQTFAITDREGRFEVWLDATRLYELVANCREIGPTDGGGFKWSGPSQATAQVRVPNVRPGGPELEIRLP